MHQAIVMLAGQLEGGEVQMWAMLASLVGALVFLAKHQTKITGLLIQHVSDSTKATTELRGELAMQGEMNRAALENQGHQARRANESLTGMVGKVACSAVPCPFATADVRKLVEHVTKSASEN